MPSSNEQTTASPFSQKRNIAGQKRAFHVLACLAGLSFSFMIYGFYIDFIRTPKPQATFVLSKEKTLAQNTNSSLLIPQPPSEKTESKVETLPETQALIQKLEEEKESFEKKKEELQEIVEGKPTSKALQTLEKEKKALEQTKLDKIEALHKEQQEQQKQKAKKVKELSPLEVAVTAPLTEKQKTQTKKQTEKHALPVKKENVLKELPAPNLIQTTLSDSLPDFGAIKKKNAENIVPLHITSPLPELLKDSRFGKLPIQLNKENAPYLAYARTLLIPPKTPYIAIVLSGLGKRENITQASIDSLPADISLSFSPYDEALKEHVLNARQVGHETLIDLPMQQGSFPETDPGPLGLVAGLPEQENRNRLYKTLAADVAFVGLVGSMNETFSFQTRQMKPFLEDIQSRGLLYVDGSDDANKPKFKHAIRPDVHIDDNFHRAAIRARLDEAKEIALKNGKAFVRIEALPITLVMIAEWIKEFQPTETAPVPEIAFAPFSYYVKQKKGLK